LRAGVAAFPHPLGISRSSRVHCPPKHRPMGWTDPLCRWTFSPAVWFSIGGSRPVTFKLPAEPSPRVSPSSRVSPDHTSPAGRSPPAPLMDFASLQRSRYRRSTLRGFCLPAKFRLQGFPTLLTVFSLRPVPVLFRTGGAPGIHPSELSPPGRHPPVSGSDAPTYRSSRRYTRHRSGRSAPAGHGFWALPLPEIPCDQTWV
jgi:hypothetical protein